MSGTGMSLEPPQGTAAEAAGASRAHATFWRRLVGTVGSRALAFVLAAGTSILTARLLGPAGQGTYSVLMTLGLLGVQIGTFGLNTSTAYHGGAVRAPVERLGGFILTFALGAGALFGLIIVAMETLAPGLLPVRGASQTVLVAVYLPLGLLAVLVQALLLGRGRVAWFNGMEVGQAALTLAGLGVLALVAGATPERFYALTLAVTAVAGVTGLLVLLRRVGPPRLPDRALVRRLIGYGARSYAANLFSFVVLYIDILMVAAILGDGDAGIYAIAAKVAEWAYALPVAGGAMLFATLMEQEPAERRGFTLDILRKAALGLPVVLVGVAVVAPFLVELLYGVEYLPGLTALYWLLPAAFALGLHTLAMNHLAATGMPWIAIAAPVAGAVLNVGLNLWLIPAAGIRGAAIASLAAYALMAAMSLGWLAVERPEAAG